MIKTPNLNLPIYNTPATDVFNLTEWNGANTSLDNAYKEIVDFREEIPKVNANAEIIEARDGETTLGAKVKKVSSHLADIEAISTGIESYKLQVPETDDTMRITRAITDLNSKGGGVLEFATKTYLISSTINIPSNKVTLKGRNNAGTIIKANASMDKMISSNDQMRVSIRDLQIHGNNLANVGLYTKNVGQLWVDNVVAQGCLEKGIFMDDGTWMFNLNNVYTLNNVDYGIYIGNDCAGSKMNMVVSEENGINLRIGYTRMIGITCSTFQRFNGIGNVLIQAGWDVTFDTCWFEATDDVIVGETYDIKLEPVYNENIGHLIRLLNCSFHGSWGETKTKHCILDGYGDTVLQNNYIDGTGGGYTSGKWYVNTSISPKVYGMNNQINGGQGYTLESYVVWHTVVGTADDKRVMFDRVRIADKIVLPAKTGEAYTYDGYLLNNGDQKDLNFSTDGKMWRLLKFVKQGTIPTVGTWKTGDIVLSDSPLSGGYVGWVCVTGGTPGTWKGFGLIQ